MPQGTGGGRAMQRPPPPPPPRAAAIGDYSGVLPYTSSFQ